MAKTEIFGILNITPDSTTGDGTMSSAEALEAAEEMFANGASYVDVGGESTRPGADTVRPEEEWRRLEPVLGNLLARYPDRISVDTYKPLIAREALAIGRVIVNDVTGFVHPAMAMIVAEHQARCIIGHLPHGCKTVAEAHALKPKLNTVTPIQRHHADKIAQLVQHELNRELIILDPGVGFGKTANLNRELLEYPDYIEGFQTMIGSSGKRFLGENRLDVDTNLIASKLSIMAGTSYIRLHRPFITKHRKFIEQLADG